MGRVLVLIQVRLATLAARQAHVFFQPIRYNDSLHIRSSNPKARKFAAKPLGKSSALPLAFYFSLFEELIQSYNTLQKSVNGLK